MKQIISGIQQIGIGVPDTYKAWEWYRKNFGMDTPVFDEKAEASLMTRYTGGKVHSRHAVLALNMQSGGGFEIWQFTSRKSEPVPFQILPGDLGIFAAKIKSRDVKKTFESFQSKKLNIIGGLETTPNGALHFFVKDPYNNIFEIVESDNWLFNTHQLTGGNYGAIFGVTDMEKSVAFWQKILSYDIVAYDKTGTFEDLNIFGSKHNYRRVLLRHKDNRTNNFSRLLGRSEIELLQVIDRTPKKIFENRFWGDQGFIHLCFDVQGMENMKKLTSDYGYSFTVDSTGSFDMGEAAGQFAYIEDPDGTLIEFVETHKIPILKKFNWYLDLQKRKNGKPLSDWIFRAMSLNRIKEK